MSYARGTFLAADNKRNYSRLNIIKQTCINLQLKACVETTLTSAEEALEAAGEQAKVLVSLSEHGPFSQFSQFHLFR